ncbi:MAG: endonuclease/exonuclease/phosphatase family protein [Chloroflexota bacterium]|nr:endonuclease/exonuclease/phosphatase family protein [Chloroflexota bacterium]
MRCLTLNIWNYSGLWTERRRAIASIIQQHLPDVVALQETRHDFRYERGRGQAEQIAELTQYIPTWALGQVYVPILRVDEGISLLTRVPPSAVTTRHLTRNGHERDDENQRLCLGLTLPRDGGPVHVFNTHFSMSAPARRQNAREVFEFVKDQSGSEPAILMGDLNAEPDTPEIRFLIGEETPAGTPPAPAGDFQDCWTALHPHEPGFTYGSGAPVRRIDYVLARNGAISPRSAEIVGAAMVNGVHLSDHMGILVEFDL